MLQVEAIAFGYGDSARRTEKASSEADTGLLFDGFSASFSAGRITAVTGPNGCGKTTLARLLTGILKPSSGRVLLKGEDLTGLSLAQIGRRIGFVMQNPSHQLFCTSVWEEVCYGLRNLALPEETVRAQAMEMLRRFDLAACKEQMPFLLSQGEKQRLMLAAVLAMQPRFLLLDEPTASLDLPRRRLLGAYLQQIVQDSGCGVVLITHDRRFTARYADAELTLTRQGSRCVAAEQPASDPSRQNTPVALAETEAIR